MTNTKQEGMSELEIIRWAQFGLQSEIIRMQNLVDNLGIRSAELENAVQAQTNTQIQVDSRATQKEGKGLRKLSKAARASISAAQKKRWANFHKSSGKTATGKKGRSKKAAPVSHLPGDDNR